MGRGVATPEVRNQGTLGGNLCQRPRCWYFRNGFGLLAVKDGKGAHVFAKTIEEHNKNRETLIEQIDRKIRANNS